MGGQLGFGFVIGGYRGYNNGRAVLVAHVVLDDHNGAIPLLLGADTLAKIRIIEVSPVLRFSHGIDPPYLPWL